MLGARRCTAVHVWLPAVCEHGCPSDEAMPPFSSTATQKSVSFSRADFDNYSFFAKHRLFETNGESSLDVLTQLKLNNERQRRRKK